LASFLPTPTRGGDDDSTAFTRRTADGSGSIESREDRPALLVSSTSWTADEDFSILLDALLAYEDAASKEGNALPKVLTLITGKGGALKEQFERSVARLEKGWKYVRVRTAWLEMADYPKLLGRSGGIRIIRVV